MNNRQRLPASLTPLDVARAALLRALTPVAAGKAAPPQAEGTGLELQPWPPCDVAAVDGWALRAADLMGASSYTPVPLTKAPIWAEAGDRIPEGRDCVVDDDTVDPAGPIAQALGEAIPGQGIRRKGGAITDASRIVDAWRPSRRRSQRGVRLRVVNIPGGEITAKLIEASLRASGIDAVFVEAAARDKTSIAQVLDGEDCDLLIIVGGSGVGRTDAAVLALAKRGEVVAHGLALQPGRTAAVGRIGATPVIALPGAPDQALAVWWTLALPTLDRLTDVARETATKPLARKIASSVGIAEIVLLDETDGAWMPLSVGDLPFTTIAQARAWLVVPGSSEGYAAGTPVDAYVLRQ